jgi:transcriptional regulator with XRE-family HTH domain
MKICVSQAGRRHVTNGLKTARNAREWSQERLVREIERYARQHMLDVASTASLRVYVSEWENGRRSISARYAKILRALLGITDDELAGKTELLMPAPTTD